MYKIRSFSSKGASLVLFWTLLVSTVLFTSVYLVSSTQHISFHLLSTPIKCLSALPILTLLSAPLCGWLADAKFGNYKIFQAGTLLLYASTLMYCILLILEALVWKGNGTLKWIYLCLNCCVCAISVCLLLATALPLGLDQMPDASSSSIASYIAWFACTVFIGDCIGECISSLIKGCTEEKTKINYELILFLVLSICMSIVLFSDFLLKKKWLIVEPESPQSFNTIYQVLKFAAKHKAPLNRSAFTYWEEDIPSRIDLGKSKYGGPFTTEQVEDVKTIFRLLCVSVPFFFIGFALFFGVKWEDFGKVFPGLSGCKYSFVYFLLSKYSIYSFLTTLAHEFLVYPFIGTKLPSIMKRFVAASLIMTLVLFVCLVLKLFSFFFQSATGWIVYCLYNIFTGLLSQVLLTSYLEFMCAQSPYNMRGLLLSLATPIFLLSYGLGESTKYIWMRICLQPFCTVISFELKTALCLIGFLLFCAVARWYKMRVRDENYSTHRVVEEVYDRYLTAARRYQPRLYGSIS